MRRKGFPRVGTQIAMIAMTLIAASTQAFAQQETVLHSFVDDHSDGAAPIAGMTLDLAGNLYGTTASGGAYSAGTVYELRPEQGSGWTEEVLHSFDPNSGDGNEPWGRLIFDASGNLYGTTYFGGGYNSGTIFVVMPHANGGWSEKVLYSFRFSRDGADGGNPASGLVFDAHGNLFGTTFYGGTGLCTEGYNKTVLGCGTVFELSPQQDGSWTERILYSFLNSGTGPIYPIGTLVFDSAGNLYGTSISGGSAPSCGCGTVFQLSPTKSGEWVQRVLQSFTPESGGGSTPQSGVIFDAFGNLYGTTTNGGGCLECQGTVFELSPSQDGHWKENVLHRFNQNGRDGFAPFASVTFDSGGNLYGTTTAGGVFGTSASGGVVFELTPNGGGSWTERVVHNFDSDDEDGGSIPEGNLIIDKLGNLYGTTLQGGTHEGGTAFRIMP